MRYFIIILIFVVLLIPHLAVAKRGPQPKVEPVEYEGIRYTAQIEDRQHCVQASDIKTGKMLWEVTVYRTFIIPLMEEDVQWVFIKQMFIEDGKLIVVAEDERNYSIDLRSHAVKKLKPASNKRLSNNSLQATAAALSVAIDL